MKFKVLDTLINFILSQYFYKQRNYITIAPAADSREEWQCCVCPKLNTTSYFD
jgi:hypothetical protein